MFYFSTQTLEEEDLKFDFEIEVKDHQSDSNEEIHSPLSNKNDFKKKKISKPVPTWTSSVTTKEDYFECSICENTIFLKKYEATNHFIDKHLEDQNEFEVCQYCIDVFSDINKLKEHYESVHSG